MSKSRTGALDNMHSNDYGEAFGRFLAQTEYDETEDFRKKS